jgi:hypothetical protein
MGGVISTIHKIIRSVFIQLSIHRVIPGFRHVHTNIDHQIVIQSVTVCVLAIIRIDIVELGW